MRIGIDARLNGYRAGGIAEYTRCLIGALAQLDQTNDYRILTAARAKIDAESLTPAPNFREVKVYTPAHHRFERTALAVEVSRLGLDILHSPDFIPPRFGAHRRVITIHDLNFLYYPQFQTPDSLAYYAGQIQAAVREADHILAVSQSAANDLVNRLKVSPEKITVQYEGVDPVFRPLSNEEIQPILKRFDLPLGYLLFVGTLEPRKNIIGLLEAYAALHDAPPLVIVGRRGWLYEPILQRIETLKLGNRVRWLESVRSSELPAVYNGAVSLVMPSFYEGFGLPVLEAMACGTPTIVSRRGSLPELVGETGQMFDPDHTDSLVEALTRVLSDESLRADMRQSGLNRAASFTWRHTAEIALSVYRYLEK